MWESIGKLLKKQKLEENDYKVIEEWILLHHLSSSPISLTFAGLMNIYPKIPTYNKIRFFESAMPKMGYLKYPKKDKEKDKLVELIIKHFKVNEKIAKEYYSILSVNDLEMLEKMYDLGTVRKKNKKENNEG